MSVEGVIAEIDIQIDRLQQARELLTETIIRKGPGRPRATSEPAVQKKRTMSAAGRARIAAAQKARWAKSKKTASKQVTAKAATSK